MKPQTIKRSSFLYRYTKWLWGSFITDTNVENTKNACNFLWGRLIGGTLILIFGSIVLFGIVVPIVWFLGYHFIRKEDKNKYTKDRMCYNYKFNGKTYQRFAPWEIAIAISVLGAIIYLSAFNQSLGTDIGKITGLAVASLIGLILILALLLTVFSRGWRSTIGKAIRETTATRLKNACPPIKYVD
ncbi:hypothetical protein LCGC14_0103080 [marine sediment metagenome]|uniref:Uncharacterized protein n=1 Tax=marine sediment metagenome TaxID=412755 RepID=A0A0F9VSH1_9ZZZZ